MTCALIFLVISVVAAIVVYWCMENAPEGEEIEGVGFVRKDDEK